MRIKQSFLLNGPQITDNLAGFLTGLDVSGTGVDGGSPGDTSYFSLYISAEATEEEKAIYDYLKYLKVMIQSVANYGGDESAQEDYLDILELGDLGYGLALKNPSTGLYDIIFNSTNYNTESGALTLKKEWMLMYDLSDVNNPTIINNYGFASAIIDNASSGYTLVSTTAVFNDKMVGNRIFNKDKNESAVIEQYVNSTTVILASSVSWDGDEIFMKNLIEPMDGLIAVNDTTAEVIGNFAKLDFKFSLPSNYNRIGIKQFQLRFMTRI